MNWRFLPIGLLVALSAAHANDAPLRYHNKDTVFVLHKGRPISISVGYNDVDQPRNMNCKAAKCVILVNFLFPINAIGAWACAFVDGKSALPDCTLHANLGFPYSRQFLEVTQGDHTVQSKVYSDNTGTLGDWEVDYTVYDVGRVQ